MLTETALAACLRGYVIAFCLADTTADAHALIRPPSLSAGFLDRRRGPDPRGGGTEQVEFATEQELPRQMVATAVEPPRVGGRR